MDSAQTHESGWLDELDDLDEVLDRWAGVVGASEV